MQQDMRHTPCGSHLTTKGTHAKERILKQARRANARERGHTRRCVAGASVHGPPKDTTRGQRTERTREMQKRGQCNSKIKGGAPERHGGYRIYRASSEHADADGEDGSEQRARQWPDGDGHVLERDEVVRHEDAELEQYHLHKAASPLKTPENKRPPTRLTPQALLSLHCGSAA